MGLGPKWDCLKWDWPKCKWDWWHTSLHSCETAHNQYTYMHSAADGTIRYNDNITLNYDFAKGGTTRQEQA